ncbi:hypothetical protein FOMPIDRAFT_1055423 [Fomitopsis schrenkii]|uniref:Uncharacterized protein n=1 Tax=Fomitopsis schrenkii TaxID=2126942 RepID=S8DS75_FOMSC|nr:hypothetical protein FOMPIDRAFT_1055423 [Fomitopsis schrenkii]
MDFLNIISENPHAGNLAHLASSCLDPGLTRDLPASGAARMAEVAGTALNINDVLFSTDIFTEDLVVEAFRKRVYPGGIQGPPSNATGLVGVGAPSIGSLSPLTPLSPEGSPALGISNINNDDINNMLQLVGMDLLLGESPDVKPELRQKLLPSEDEVTNTILKLLDSSSPGVSPSDLARVLGRCRICGHCASRTALLGHECGGRADFANDSFDANAYYGASSQPLGSQIKLEATDNTDVISISSDEDSEQADNKPNMMIDLTADEPVMYRIWDHGVIDLTDD